MPAASEPAPSGAAAADVSWTGRAGTFNLRVAAVIVRGGDILICTVDGVGH